MYISWNNGSYREESPLGTPLRISYRQTKNAQADTHVHAQPSLPS